MFITKKKHTKILKEQAENYAEKHKKLTEELKEAKDFKALIERLATPFNLTSSNGFSVIGSYDPLSSDHEININIKENIATLVNDELSKDIIIKQKATKIVFLNKEGGIEKTGYTKQRPDKGYFYKLIRKNA